MTRHNDDQLIFRVLEQFNRSTMDDVGPLGSDQGMAVLKYMNDFEEDNEEFFKSLAPTVNVLQKLPPGSDSRCRGYLNRNEPN